MAAISLEPTWRGCLRDIVVGLREPMNSQAFKAATKHLENLADVADYHRAQERTGTEYGISAMVPLSIFALAQHAAEIRMSRA